MDGQSAAVYPKVEDIQTLTDATIKEMIITEYKDSNPDVQIDDIDYSINQDAKSIFFTQHKKNTVVPYHLDNVYLRSSQNSQPNSDTPDMNSRKKR